MLMPSFLVGTQALTGLSVCLTEEYIACGHVGIIRFYMWKENIVGLDEHCNGVCWVIVFKQVPRGTLNLIPLVKNEGRRHIRTFS
jgi:hypothetical protein